MAHMKFKEKNFLISIVKKHYQKMRSASCRKIVWSEILKELQNSGYFNDKTVQWLFKSKWPGLKSNVEKKFVKSKRLSTIDEEIIETERLKDPLFCFLVGEDRKSVRSDVYDCMNWILKEVTGDEAEEEAPDEDDDFADFDYSPTEETHENVNHFVDDGFDDSDAEVIDFSSPSSHEPNVESCVESEQEHPLKTNPILQQIMPSSDECIKAYINFLASIEKEWIHLLKLKQEKTKQKIRKTKLEIEKLTNV